MLTPRDPDAALALTRATDLAAVTAVVRSVARRLCSADGATFVIADGDECFYADEDSIAPLWKGQRFPASQCISGWAMINDTPAVVTDIRNDVRIPQEAYAPTFVRSLAMFPVGHPPVAAIGVYWAVEREITLPEWSALRDLADLTASAVKRVGLDSAPWAPTFRVG